MSDAIADWMFGRSDHAVIRAWISAPHVDPIPLHNRVLPTQRDLCRLWQLSCGEGRYA